MGEQHGFKRKRAYILLEVLELSGVAMSPEMFAVNFDLSEDRVQESLEYLASNGLVTVVGDEYYEVTELGKEEVIVRSPCAAD